MCVWAKCVDMQLTAIFRIGILRPTNAGAYTYGTRLKCEDRGVRGPFFEIVIEKENRASMLFLLLHFCHSEKQFHDQTQGSEAIGFRLTWRIIVREYSQEGSELLRMERFRKGGASHSSSDSH